MLYRPFLHYASPRLSAGKHVDERYYACAAACISVSRNLVHIGIEIKRQGVLIGPYWVILYTQFFAILSLLFYALENPDKPGTTEILADAHAGRELVASLSNRSLAADRVTEALNVRFPERTHQSVYILGCKLTHNTPCISRPYSSSSQTGCAIPWTRYIRT